MALPVPVNPSTSPNSPSISGNPTSPSVNLTGPASPSTNTNPSSNTAPQHALFSPLNALPNSPPQFHNQIPQSQVQPGLYQPYPQHVQHTPSMLGTESMGSFSLSKRSLGDISVDDRQDLKRSKAEATERNRAFYPDYRTPFVDLQDAHFRLACYHTLGTTPETEGDGPEQLLTQATSLMTQLDVLHQQIQTAAIAWSDGGLYREDLAVLERLAFYDEKTETDALKLQYSNAQLALSRTGRPPTSTSPSLTSSPSTPLTTSTPPLPHMPNPSLTPSLVPSLAPSLVPSLTSPSSTPFATPFGQQYQAPYSPSINAGAPTGYLQAPTPHGSRLNLPINSIPSPSSMLVAGLGVDTNDSNADLGVDLEASLNVDLDADALDAKVEGGSNHSNLNDGNGHVTDLDNVVVDSSGNIGHDSVLGSVLDGLESDLSNMDDLESGDKEDDKNDQQDAGGSKYYSLSEDAADGSNNETEQETEHQTEEIGRVGTESTEGYGEEHDLSQVPEQRLSPTSPSTTPPKLPMSPSPQPTSPTPPYEQHHQTPSQIPSIPSVSETSQSPIPSPATTSPPQKLPDQHQHPHQKPFFSPQHKSEQDAELSPTPSNSSSTLYSDDSETNR